MLRWNRRNRSNTLPAQPIPKNCYVPFAILLFHLVLLLKVVKGMQSYFAILLSKAYDSSDFQLIFEKGMDPFPKRHRLVHNGGFPKFEALYCRVNMVNSTEIS